MSPVKKKVLYVITKSTWGGAQRYVYDLATSLPNDEFEAVVIAPEGGLLTERLAAAGIRVIPTAFSQKRNFFFTLATLGSLFPLIRIFTEERPDVIHTNSAKAGGLGALAGRISGVPNIVFTAHGWSFLEERPMLIRGLIYFFSWLTALLSHTVITISKNDYAIAKRMLLVGRKAVLIYNGINPLSLASGETIRKAFRPHARITGTIGELTENKNQVRLIEAARNDPSLYVAIVGEGVQRSFLESKIRAYGLADRVKLFGFLPDEDVLRGFDVFALPSLKEGLPYVLIEAKMAGLPIEAHRVGGVGEILDAEDMRVFSLEHMVAQTIALYR